jgi:adenosine deaminase
MAALGLKLHPNSDDPAFHQVTPSQVWELMVSHFGFGLADLRGFMLNGLDGAWIDDSTRATWEREWAAEFDRLAAACP